MKYFSIKRLFVFVCSLIIIFFSAPLAQAAYVAESNAILDWSTFTVMGIDIGYGEPQISWLSQNEEVSASANEDYQHDYAYNWNSSLNVVASDENAKSSAWIDVENNKMGASSGSSGNSWAYASASRHGDFQVSGTGIVMFMIDYEINVALNNSATDAWASSYVSIEISNNDYTRWSYSSAEIWKSLWDGEIGSWSDDGMLVAAMFFYDGEIGHFDAWASTDSSSYVPIPSTLLLLGSGLIGVLAIKRRNLG